MLVSGVDSKQGKETSNGVYNSFEKEKEKTGGIERAVPFEGTDLVSVLIKAGYLLREFGIIEVPVVIIIIPPT